MKKLILSLVLLISGLAAEAQDLNKFKYVVVPEIYDFADREDQYQINSLTEFLFEKFGFNAYMKSEDKPEDLDNDNCLALRADVKDNSGIFVTKMKVLLEDCRGNVVFESKEGRSREKEFKKAWHEALRDAFTSIDSLNYNYDADPVTEVNEETEEGEAEMQGMEAEVEAEVEAEAKEAAEEIEEATEVAEEVAESVSGQQPELTEAESPASEKYFVRENAVFFLKDNGDGYSFYQKGMAEPFAVLVKSDMGKAFIYNSMTKQGMAYFDKSGNLVVEFYDRNRNKSVKTVYEVQN
ncbi:hypothetical protein [Salegentibacter chungangensis]|uniref:Uncharacterized protein n=1 Tax=Salegentibacter chungangensis TaxID=1335724 RepID=A0ABW3NW64_9FLAO